MMFEEVNKLVDEQNVLDFEVQSFEAGRLLIIGSFDLAYYHQAELLFDNVSFLSVPTLFHEPVFRLATAAEQSEVQVAIEGTDQVFAVDCEASQGKTTGIVVAESVSIRLGRVYHYERQNLGPGERIAPWAKRSAQPAVAADEASPRS